MIAITVVFPMLENILSVQNKVLKAIVFSIHISFMMAPIIAYHYYELPTYSVIINMIVIPLMSVVIISGIAGISIGFVSEVIGRILFVPGCLVLEGYTHLCGMITKIPYATVIVGKPDLHIIVIYYGVWIAYLRLMNWQKKKSEKIKKLKSQQIPKCGKVTESKKSIEKKDKKVILSYCVLTVIVMMLLTCLIYLPIGKDIINSDDLYVTFLDVGQGDGIFMRADNGTTITVDCGSTSVKEVGKNRAIPFLKASCIRRIIATTGCWQATC